MTPILATAFAAGLVATVNPCGFAMLPAYLGYLLGERGSVGGSRVVKVGVAVALGFVSVFLVAGVIITAGIRAVVGFIPWLAALVGAGLIVVGLGQLFGRRLLPGVYGPSKARKSSTIPGMFAFGASYGVASLSCTLPIFLSLVAGSVAGAGFAQGVATFAAYGMGLAVAVMMLTVAIATGRDRLIARVRPLARHLDVISGGFLLAAGAFIIWYWATVLSSGAAALAESSLVLVAEQVASDLTRVIAGNPLLVAAIGLIVVIGGLGLLTRRGDREDGPADMADDKATTDLLLPVLLAMSVVLASCTPGGSIAEETQMGAADATPTDLVGLTDVETVEELAVDFNDDAGSARLILLLSPT